MKFKIKVAHQVDADQWAALLSLIEAKGSTIMANLDTLTTAVNALADKAKETETTLAVLAQAVIDLKASMPPDQQPAIDALAAQAQAALDGLTAAEDSADDQIPA